MKLKEVLETLDIEFDLDEGDLVTDVLVLAKVQRLDGPSTVLHATSEGTDSVTTLGLLAAGGKVIGSGWEPYDPG